MRSVHTDGTGKLLTTKSFHSSLPKIGGAALALALLAPIALSWGADWHIKEAPIRFRLNVTSGPSHKSAGYFVQLPDGGLLPAPCPQPQVVTSSGKQLATYVMWQNRSSGIGIVFESDGSSDVYVYVSPGSKLKLWNSSSGLTPSAITCVQPGAGGMAAAQALGRLGAVGPTVHYRNKAGTGQCALCLQGDQSGRPAPSSFYMLSYVNVTDAGSTWIAPFFQRGNSEMRVDDRTISPQKKSAKWGGTGQAMDLSAGPHKVEIFSACDASVDYTSEALVWFTWAPPHATDTDLGGITTNAPFAGQRRWDSRVLRDSEVARSGSCSVREITLRDGGPVAYYTADARDVFWFEGGTPTIVYNLTAMTAGNPKDTTYTWNFGDNAKPTGEKVVWLFAGLKDQPITLTATWSNQTSRCTIPLFTFSTIKSSLESSATRESFRAACLNVIKSYPDDADPAASWDKSMWDTFYQCQEVGKGAQLLAEVLVNRSSFFRTKIPAEKQVELEDIFFQSISFVAPDKAIEWLKSAERSAKADRRTELKIMQAEVYMYHKKDLAAAKSILTPLAAQGAGDAHALASIRLGDVAFLERNVNDANRYWGSIQRGVKLTDNVIKGDDVEWRGEAKPEEKKDDEKDKEKVKDKHGLTPLAPLKRIQPKVRVTDWKKAAVLDTDLATSVIVLLKQGAYLDAYHQLQKWERNFPMSKMSSDYVNQEATFYMTIGNNQRARTMLEAYCENVDASSYLASAAELLLRCMMYDRESDEVLSKFCDTMKKRFQFHPFADRVNSMLRQIRATEVAPDKAPEGL